MILTHDAVAAERPRLAGRRRAAGGARRARRHRRLPRLLGLGGGRLRRDLRRRRRRRAHAFVEPAAFPRYGDALVADQVSTAAELGLYQAPLHLQGGNVLIGDDFFFIGIDYPLLTFEEGILTAPAQAGEDELLRQVYRRYLDAERTFVPVGTTLPVPAATRREFRLGGVTWVEDLYAGNAPGTRQPIFHIDMFVSLAGRGDDGRYRVLVGDPRAAAQLTGEPLQPHAMAPVFDDIARDLGAARLRRDAHAAAARLLRRPRCARALVVLRDLQQRARPRARAASGRPFSSRPTRTARSPTRSPPPIGATPRSGRALGYDVVALEDFHPFAINLGAAHCIKKYLARG